jgi:hypothetical protein
VLVFGILVLAILTILPLFILALIMEKKFWLVTLVFFVTVTVCFLLIASKRLPGTISPAVASPHQVEQTLPLSDFTRGNP